MTAVGGDLVEGAGTRSAAGARGVGGEAILAARAQNDAAAGLPGRAVRVGPALAARDRPLAHPVAPRAALRGHASLGIRTVGVVQAAPLLGSDEAGVCRRYAEGSIARGAAHVPLAALVAARGSALAAHGDALAHAGVVAAIHPAFAVPSASGARVARPIVVATTDEEGREKQHEQGSGHVVHGSRIQRAEKGRREGTPALAPRAWRSAWDRGAWSSCRLRLLVSATA